MAKLSYYIRVARGTSWKRTAAVLDKVKEKSGQNRLYTFLDMLVCAARYGAGFHDYLIFAFYNMNHRQRDTYLTRMRNKRLNTLMDDEAYTPIFENKNLFDKRFRDYLGRDFRDVAELSEADFAAFMADKAVIFAKPNRGESGKGIERLEKDAFGSIAQMYRYVIDPAHNFGVIEQALTQHPDLNRLYPNSINSYRIVTLVVDGAVHCLYAVSKCGNCGKFVDNLENDGLACPIDQQTGKICGCAHTSKLVNYDRHPATGVELVGFKLPYVPEAIALAKKAALEVPQVGYLGWDVCITPAGPVIIEGNTYPGYDFWQLPEHTPDRIGLYPRLRELIPAL